jgi:hypothetical protein
VSCPEKALLVIDTMDIEPGATVMAYYDAREITPDTVYELYKELVEKFPENDVIVLPNSFSLKLFDIDTLIFLREQIDELLGDFADYE